MILIFICPRVYEDARKSRSLVCALRGQTSGEKVKVFCLVEGRYFMSASAPWHHPNTLRWHMSRSSGGSAQPSPRRGTDRYWTNTPGTRWEGGSALAAGEGESGTPCCATGCPCAAGLGRWGARWRCHLAEGFSTACQPLLNITTWRVHLPIATRGIGKQLLAEAGGSPGSSVAASRPWRGWRGTVAQAALYRQRLLRVMTPDPRGAGHVRAEEARASVTTRSSHRKFGAQAPCHQGGCRPEVVGPPAGSHQRC